MFCNDCGSKLNNKDAVICVNCGASLTHNLTQGKHSGKAIASLVLGIIGLFAMCIPCFGFPVTITGLILGALGLKSEKRNMAMTGLILSIIGLIFTLINSIWGAYIGFTDPYYY